MSDSSKINRDLEIKLLSIGYAQCKFSNSFAENDDFFTGEPAPQHIRELDAFWKYYADAVEYFSLFETTHCDDSDPPDELL